MPEKVTLQGIHPPKRTPAELGPPPFSLDPSEDLVSTPEPSPAPRPTAPAGIDDAPTDSDPPRAPEAPAPKRRQLSVAQKAVIAERTDRILKSARPGSVEYADACRERAEAGLVVPALKNTEMSLHAFQQFAQFNAAEFAASEKRATRRTAIAVLGGLGVLTAALAAYVFLDRPTPSAPTPAPTASAAAPTAATTTAAAPKLEASAASVTEASASSPPGPAGPAPPPTETPSTTAAAPPDPPKSTAMRPGTPATPAVKSTATAKSTSKWEPAWVAPK